MTIGGPAGDPLWMWTFHSDGWTPDPLGVYRHEVKASPHPFSRQSAFKRRINTSPGGEFIPYVVFDSGNKQGVYIGVEWGFCHIEAVARADDRPASVSVFGGASDGGPFTLQGRETLDAPPGFIGAYQGDPDDAGNVLRKWLFKYNTPAVVRNDPTYPKVQWNAFSATGETPGSWKCLESKYDRLIDAIGPLGFEEAMIDVGWWEGGTRAPEPKADPVRWPSGMAKASEYTRKAGLRFGLYWNKGVAYVFRPGSPEQTQTLRLRGLDAKSRYKLSFEDGSNPAVTMTGDQLMDEGLKMSLGSTFTSEWVWIDQNQ